jgi:hypothetical protein
MTDPSVEQSPAWRDLPAFSQQAWQMSYGERSTIEGVLAMTKPRLAFEIGRAEGGSLRRIAQHSDEVVSFDIVEASAELSSLTNVRPLAGDSHALLPAELRRVADVGGNVDFVLVDGDHTADGVRRDMEDLLDSAAIQSTVILAHDTLNDEVRQGLEEVDYASYAKVAWVDLDFVPGYVARLPARLGECWGGLGLVVVDASGAAQPDRSIQSEDLFDQSKLVWPTARWIRRAGAAAGAQISEVSLVDEGELLEAQRQVASLASELERHRAWLQGIERSVSWQITAPLRSLKARLRDRSSS